MVIIIDSRCAGCIILDMKLKWDIFLPSFTFVFVDKSKVLLIVILSKERNDPNHNYRLIWCKIDSVVDLFIIFLLWDGSFLKNIKNHE